jgi:hypothetical protein
MPCGSKPAPANSWRDLTSKKKKRKKITKKGRVVWLKVEALSSNPVLKKKNY